MRPAITLSIDGRATLEKPSTTVRKLTVRPPGLSAPLDALVATPQNATGVLVYFPGFNTPLGPWESAKCQLIAQASGMNVVVTEIPGMSRFGDAIPKAIRRDMLAERTHSWAELNLHYVVSALGTAGVDAPSHVRALGYSTGCSLAAAALPLLDEWAPVVGLSLVEPVAISRRSLVGLHVDNMTEIGRQPATYRTNRPHDWVMSARRRQIWEPPVRYGPVDLIAIATVLAAPGLMEAATEIGLNRCELARGERSSLCRRHDFETLDALLVERGVSGPTLTVTGLGHPVWHSFPAIVPLVEAMLTASDGDGDRQSVRAGDQDRFSDEASSRV